MFRLCIKQRSPLPTLAEHRLCGWPQHKILFVFLWHKKYSIWDLHSSVTLCSFFTEISGTTYRCHLQRPSSLFWTSWFTKTGPDRSSRNVGNYQYALRNIQQERRPYLHRSGSLKSRKVLSCVAKLSIGLAVKNCALVLSFWKRCYWLLSFFLECDAVSFGPVLTDVSEIRICLVFKSKHSKQRGIKWHCGPTTVTTCQKNTESHLRRLESL